MLRRSRMSVCRYFVALASLGLAVAVPPAEAWLRRFGGAVQVVRNVAVATAADSRGDVVTITHASSDLGVCRATARKRAGRTGRLLWERALGTCPYPGSVVAIDASDDVVAGLSGFVVAKLDGRRGEVVWDTALEEGAPWESGAVSALAIDPAGDVVAAGIGIRNPHDDEDRDFAVQKLRGGTGALVWRFGIGGELPPCAADDDCSGDRGPEAAANAVVVDAAGRVFAAGGVQRTNRYALTVVALDGADGGERWRYARSTPAPVPSWSEATSLVAAPGIVYVGGSVPAGGAVVIRLDAATGAEAWTRSVHDARPDAGSVAALALHRTGDVLAAGVGPGPALELAFATRLTPAGAVVWRHESPFAVGLVALTTASDGSTTLLASERPAGPDPGQAPVRSHVVRLGDDGTPRWDVSAGEDAAEQAIGAALAMAAVDGDVVVGGAIRAGDASSHATVARLRGTDGAAAWRATTESPAGGDDDAKAVAADAAGDLFVVGAVQNAYLAGHQDFAVLKLARRTGAELWRREIEGTSQCGDVASGYRCAAFDDGIDVAVDSAGDAVAAGTIENGVYDFDAGIVKLDGATGAERWRTLLHTGELRDRDYAQQVLVDEDDHAVALTLLRDAAGRAIPHVVSLDGVTGVERWRRVPPLEPFVNPVAGIARAADGVVAAAGSAWDGATGRHDAVLLAWDARSGGERWRTRLPGVHAAALAVDARGRLVVGGSASPTQSWGDPLIVVVDGSSGAEVHRTVLTDGVAPAPASVVRLAADRRGGVVAAGFSSAAVPFVALVSATGDTSWRRTITPAGLPFGAAVAALEVTPGGNVVLACTVCDYLSSINGLLVGLGARDGVERWRRTVDGDAAPGDVDAVRDLTLTPQGDLVAVGVTQWDDTGRDLTALRMRARTGRARGLGRLDPRGGPPR